MKDFARVSKLSDIGGRGDYISNPKRQEKILAKSAPVDWKPYQQFEQENRRTAKQNNEGREVVISLPNEWAKLPKWELARRAQSIAETAIGKSTDLQWAVHWNKAHTNLHLHAVFSERQREDQGVWDRDIYQTADGKVARRKADRAKGEDGKDLPPVHRKGEPKGNFTAKDPRYATKAWVYEMKAAVKQHMEDRWRVKFDKANLLNEYHEGKGKDAPKIRAKNEVIRAINLEYARLLDAPAVNHQLADKLRAAALSEAKRGCKVVVYPRGELIACCDLQHWMAKEDRNTAKAGGEPRKKPTERSESVFERVRGWNTARKEKKAAQKALRAEKQPPLPEGVEPIPHIPMPHEIERDKERQREDLPAKSAGQSKAQSMAEWDAQIAASRAARPADPKMQKEKSKGKTAPEGR